MNTKMVLTALGLATLVATPALAQKHTNRGHLQSAVYSATAVNPSLVVDGRLIGTDPDPAIRFEIARDAATYTTGN